MQIKEQQERLLASVPRLVTDNYVLDRAYRRGVMDFAALRLKGRETMEGEYVLAAGIPWFTALFGRDSLIASYQALPYLPEVARGTLRTLAKYQGTKVDRVSGEQPGKILHEVRPSQNTGRAWIPTMPYYGTIDATPLFLILLSEVYRFTGELGFARELIENVERAIEWMDSYGDRDGDGYLEYIREADVGLENQGWKDSWDAIQFRNGRLAKPPIALCEVQGYAYDARMRMAEIYDALGRHERGRELRQQATTLRERFNRDFWLADRNCFALALDESKRPVDALASNQGHSLWSGIVDGAKAKAVAEALTSPEMFGGWGVRTLGKSERGYNPLGYHVGSIWPHDNSIITAGLVRHGFDDAASAILKGLLHVISVEQEARLPELISGYGDDEFPFPVRYPIAAGVQAWASATPLHLLTSLLGLSVDAPRRKIYLSPFLPEGTNHLEVAGIRIGDGEFHVSVDRAYGEVQTKLRRVPKGFKVEGTISHWSIFW